MVSKNRMNSESVLWLTLLFPNEYILVPLSVPCSSHQRLPSCFCLQFRTNLVPKDPHFPAVDSILYHPCEVLTGIQVTIILWLSLTSNGFKDGLNEALRLLNLDPLFRASIGDSYLWCRIPSETVLRFSGNTITQEWATKVDQYVLGIQEDTIWNRAKNR
jgi:hypothetical protein